MEATYSDLLSVLKGQMEREQGKDARINNITEALETGRLVESSFGPKGLKKMIDGTVVEKGSRILGAAAPEHPVQKMIVDMAKDVENEIGDATTSSVILTTYLLEEARDLIELGINPSALINGYSTASEWALEELDLISSDADPYDKEMAASVLMTAWGEKNDLGEDALEVISDLFILKGPDFDSKDIQVETEISHEKNGVRMILGTRIDNEIDTEKERLIKPRILLLKGDIKPRKTKLDLELQLNSVDAYRSALDQESILLKRSFDRIKETRADLVLLSGEADDRVKQMFDRQDILLSEKVKEGDLKRTSRATGAEIVDVLDILPDSAVMVENVVIKGDDACVGGVCGV
ncbi:MAG: TCP-1/cpn60 chaperonin family protein [Candidatus Thermoplasmatota archaeon]|nr:TCP-1/cpn60 chaperonin family protein [Candidatus Thermoplasmatota archaeon]